MFQTLANAELHHLAAIDPEPELGSRYWSYVIARLTIPWFQVSIRGQVTRHLLAHSLKQWLHLSESPEIQISEVTLVSPGWLNGTDRWRMDRLEQVLIGTHPATDEEVIVYALEGGQRIIQSNDLIRESDLWGLSVTFDASALSPSGAGSKRR